MLSRISVAFAVITALWLMRGVGPWRGYRARRGGRRRHLRPYRPGARRPAVRGRRRVGPGRLRHARRVRGLRGDRRGGQLSRRSPVGDRGGRVARDFRRRVRRGRHRRGLAAGDHRGHPHRADGDGGRVRARSGAAGDQAAPVRAAGRHPAASGLRRRPAVRRPGGLPRRACPRRGRARRDDHRRHPSRTRPRRSFAATGATAGSRSGSAGGSTARCRPYRPWSSGYSSPGC